MYNPPTHCHMCYVLAMYIQVPLQQNEVPQSHSEQKKTTPNDVSSAYFEWLSKHST